MQQQGLCREGLCREELCSEGLCCEGLCCEELYCEGLCCEGKDCAVKDCLEVLNQLDNYKELNNTYYKRIGNADKRSNEEGDYEQ